MGTCGTMAGGYPGDRLNKTLHNDQTPFAHARTTKGDDKAEPKADISDDALGARNEALLARYRELSDEQKRLLNSVKKGKEDERIFNASDAKWRFEYLTCLFFVMVAIVLFVGGIVVLDIEGAFAGIVSGSVFGYYLNKYIRIGKARKRWKEISKEMKEIEQQLA